jgi:hypothetical protein
MRSRTLASYSRIHPSRHLRNPLRRRGHTSQTAVHNPSFYKLPHNTRNITISFPDRVISEALLGHDIRTLGYIIASRHIKSAVASEFSAFLFWAVIAYITLWSRTFS